jgi:hypothetical protein
MTAMTYHTRRRKGQGTEVLAQAGRALSSCPFVLGQTNHVTH